MNEEKINFSIQIVKTKIVLYAPNVHVGGGVVLLKAILEEWSENFALSGIFDNRARSELKLPSDSQVIWVRPTISDRLAAEVKLKNIASSTDVVFCFHGLPPLLRLRSHVVLYHQNRLLLDLVNLKGYARFVGWRIKIERFWSKTFRFNVDHYFVQTETMRRLIRNSQIDDSRITVAPFFCKMEERPKQHIEHDFAYLADGLPHKNHERLAEAWAILATHGIRPSLVVTLGPKDRLLAEFLKKYSEKFGLNIRNCGQISRNEVTNLYSSVRCLIFPSLGESFGLPLVEASQYKIDIIAPELDYVRDVCCPTQTFDPNSSLSIARAVKRYLRVSESVGRYYSPREVLQKVVESKVQDAVTK